MNERRAASVLFHGYLLVMVALLQGFLIAVPVGSAASQARAHIESLLLAFLLVLVGLTCPSLVLPEWAQMLLHASSLGAVWLGVVHAIGVASLGAKSIHQAGTATPAIEQVLTAIGGLSVPLTLVAVGLVLFGLIARRRLSGG